MNGTLLDDRIKRAIRHGLDGQVRDLDVQVTIRLMGRCDTTALKALAEDLASELLEGHGLKNEIVVQGN